MPYILDTIIKLKWFWDILNLYACLLDQIFLLNRKDKHINENNISSLYYFFDFIRKIVELIKTIIEDKIYTPFTLFLYLLHLQEKN